MTWKGTDHIHCCTQIINLEEEEKEKKRKKKEKQLSHRLGSHARTRVQRNRGAHGARKTRRRPPPPRKRTKTNRSGGGRLLALPAWMQMPGVAWMRLPHRAPATGCKHQRRACVCSSSCTQCAPSRGRPRAAESRQGSRSKQTPAASARLTAGASRSSGRRWFY